MDGFFCQGPFCVHNGVVFQKNALPTLFNFVRVRKSHQPHVLDVVFQKFKPDLPLGLKSIGSLLVCWGAIRIPKWQGNSVLHFLLILGQTSKSFLSAFKPFLRDIFVNTRVITWMKCHLVKVHPTYQLLICQPSKCCRVNFIFYDTTQLKSLLSCRSSGWWRRT